MADKPQRHGIYLKSSGVNISGVHYEIRERSRQGLSHPGLHGFARVSGGGRTLAVAWELRNRYLRYKAGKGPKAPLAANPERVWPDGRLGSAHMMQAAKGYKVGDLSNSVSWAYALDIGFYGKSTAQDKLLLENEMRKVGMVRNVPSEWWHFVPVEAPPPYDKHYDLQAITGFGDRSDRVSDMQELLASVKVGTAVFYRGNVDGDYGPMTMDAVARFQRSTGLPEHGDWTWKDKEAAEGIAAPAEAPMTRPMWPQRPATRSGRITKQAEDARKAIDNLERLGQAGAK